MSVPVLITVRPWLLAFGGGVGLTCVSLGFTLELGEGGGATLLMPLTVLALKLGTGTENEPVKLGWLKVPVCDSCDIVGFGSVVKELVNDGKVPVNVGLLKDPVKEGSWRLAAALEEGGGGGAEREPVG